MSRRIFPGFALLLACLAGLAGPAGAQTASLVADLNPGAWESAPPKARNLFVAGGRLFFAAGEPAEPAVVDPTGTGGTAGTAGMGSTLLADLCPECGSSPEYLGSLGNVVLFVATPGGTPAENVLYRSDGTRSGTFSLGLTTERPSTSFRPARQVVAGGLFFFYHCEESTGCLLWRTDGTLAGTRQLAGLGPETVTPVGRRIFFFVVPGFSVELWTSDGTEAGTTRLLVFPERPFVRGQAGGSSRFYFLRREPSDPTWQLWVSDGSAAGTRQLTQFKAPAGVITDTLQVRGDQVYLVARDVDHGDELWTSDGTPAGTRRVTNFANPSPFPDSVTPSLVTLGNRLVFPATDGLHGLQLWTSAGSPPSTALLRPALFQSEERLIPVAGGRAVFLSQGDAGTELWGTDGTPQGTQRLPAICGGCTVGLANPLPLSGRAFFTAHAADGAVVLGSTDGTPAGTRRFGDPLPGTLSGSVTEIAAVSGQLFFTLSDGVQDSRLWTSNGQPGGTRPVPGLAAGSSADPVDPVPAAGQLAFIACDGRDRQVFRTTGTEATTAPGTHLHNVAAGCDNGAGPGGLAAVDSSVFFWFRTEVFLAEELWLLPPSGEAERLADFGFLGGIAPPLVPFGGKVYFVLPQSSDHPAQIWQSDGHAGDAGGTGPAPELAAVPRPLSIDRAGGTLYLRGSSAEGTELWASDGTAAGTHRLLTTPENLQGPFVQAGPWVFFFLRTSESHASLWRTDGTAAGTAMVRDLTPIPFDTSSPADPVASGGQLYFFANTATGRGLFRSDGTAAGTLLVREFLGEPDFASTPAPTYATVFAGRLFFTADDGIHGRELWASDGTAAGTVLVADVNPGPDSSHIAELTVVGNRLYFSAYDPVHGVELWQSDGSPTGTRLAADLAPESASSDPKHLTAVGSRLYFAADDGISGNELWTIDAAAPAGCQPSDTRLCLAGGRFQVEVDWKDFQGNTGVGHAAPLTADTGTFWFFSAANVELVVKVLDARALNQAFWVFYGALSSVDYTITVTDTQTGLSRRYHNPSGQLASVGDTNGFGPLGAFDTKTLETPASALALVAARTDPRAATGTCAAGPETLCLAGSRFALTAAWKDFQGHTGTGTAVPLTADTGYFWFFSPTNVEVVTKVLDGRGLNGKFWLFYGALSNVEYTLTVTDTQTGAVKTYKNPSGQFGSVADTGAF